MIRVEAQAAAKVNLSLLVRTARPDGLHPIAGRFQSIDWCDTIVIDPDAEPGIAGPDDRPVVAGDQNLAWRAAVGAARELEITPPGLRLDKRIAVAAGLGGGSADAAAALAGVAFSSGAAIDDVAHLAAGLGSDVPFCLMGGTADVRGTGDVVRQAHAALDYTLALVVPPVEVSTPRVYAAWDALDGPGGSEMSPAAVPPSLRGDVPVRNDLTDAAIAVAPQIAEWRGELEEVWGRPVALSGSGPTLFGFFVDGDEATAALAVVPPGARHLVAVSPVGWGWAVRFDGAERHADLVPAEQLGDGWMIAAPGVVGAALA